MVVKVLGTPEQIEIARAFLTIESGFVDVPADTLIALEFERGAIRSRTGLLKLDIKPPDVDGGLVRVGFAGSAEACALAEHYLEGQYVDAMREDIEFEEELRPEVIGKGGSNMREAKTASGCCYLDVVRGENYAVVVGTEDQIDIARQCVFSSFRTRITACYSDRVETGPDFVPG